MQVRLRFGLVARNPLQRSCASRARNAGEIAFWIGREQPSAEIVRGRKTQVRLCLGLIARNPLRRSCAPRARNAGEIAFWIGRASLLEEVSYEMLVLETWRFTFGGSLVRNAGFGDLAPHFWRKSRTKRLFWRLGASLLKEVSYETLVLETWRFTFGGSLERNAGFGDLAPHFWRKSRTKRSFWRLGASLLEEVSYETLVLEPWRFTFGGSLVRNACFGDFGALLLEEDSYETLVLETWRFTFGGSLVRNAGFRDLALHFWRKSRTKRWFWSHLWSWTQTWPVCSANVVRERAFWSWTQKWSVL